MSEKIVDMGTVQQDLEQQIAERDRTIERLKARRVVDLDRLAEVSRARDLLERRGAAQMAKVHGATAKLLESEDQLREIMKDRDDLASQLERSIAINAKASVDRRDLKRQIDDLVANREQLGQERDRYTDATSAPSFDATARLFNAICADAADRDALTRLSRRRDSSRLAAKAAAAYARGKLDEAQTLFATALLFGATSGLWTQFGHVLREGGDFSAALGAYEHALQLKPGVAETTFLIGYCAEQRGEAEKASNNYDAALEIDPALAEKFDHLRDYRSRLSLAR